MLMFAMCCSSLRSHQLHPHLHILIASSSPPFDHHHLPHQCPSIASVAFPISCFLTSSPSIDSHSSIIPSPLPCHLHNIFIQTTSLFASPSPYPQPPIYSSIPNPVTIVVVAFTVPSLPRPSPSSSHHRALLQTSPRRHADLNKCAPSTIEIRTTPGST